jgi:hypothetical protein
MSEYLLLIAFGLLCVAFVLPVVGAYFIDL